LGVGQYRRPFVMASVRDLDGLSCAIAVRADVRLTQLAEIQ
jgi:hypothetical protein